MHELLRRLKPLYGAQVDRLWIEYQLADGERRREIEELVTILAIKRLGMMIGQPRLVLDAPPPEVIGSGEFTLGAITYPGLEPYPLRVRRNELLRHLFILGPTGTGKSTLILHLLRQLLYASIPFMVFDFKRNYRCLLHTSHEELIAFSVGRNHAPLRINALTPPSGVAFAEWAEALADIISTSYLLMQGARNVFKNAFTRAAREEKATMRTALAILRTDLVACRTNSRRYGWLESATRSVEELCAGAYGEALNASAGTALPELLRYPVVFELQGCGEDQKRFFTLLFLQGILLLRKHESTAREELQHLLVIDEAHNVFPREPPGDLGVPARLAREVREYGEALISATQQADVSESLIANAGIKVILRCDYPKDIRFASQLLQIEEHWIPTLPPGTGIARLPVRYYHPILFTFTPQELKNRPTSDDLVHARWMTHPLRQPVSERPLLITPRDEMLLGAIRDHPSSTITEHYRRAGWHPEIGNRTKTSIITKGLARIETIRTPTGTVKLLTLTPLGREHLGVGIAPQRFGGATHRYWKGVVRKQLETDGWTVTEEAPLGAGRSADLHAVRGVHQLYVEIETGRSDIAATVAKYEHITTPLLVVFTNVRSRTIHEPLITLLRPGTICTTLQSVSDGLHRFEASHHGPACATSHRPRK